MASACITKRIQISDRWICYTLERKRVKNLNLRVRPDGTVAVSAPPRVPEAAVEQFVLRHGDFLLRALARQAAAQERAPGPRQYLPGERLPYLGGQVRLEVVQGADAGAQLDGDRLRLTVPDPGDLAQRRRTAEAFFDAACRQRMQAVVDALLPAFAGEALPPVRLRFRRMTSRWGSCQPRTGVVCLNLYLIAVPPACMEYVALHELTHFLQPDHSPRFHALLARRMPDWQARRRALGQYRLTKEGIFLRGAAPASRAP